MFYLYSQEHDLPRSGQIVLLAVQVKHAAAIFGDCSGSTYYIRALSRQLVEYPSRSLVTTVYSRLSVVLPIVCTL